MFFYLNHMHMVHFILLNIHKDLLIQVKIHINQKVHIFHNGINLLLCLQSIYKDVQLYLNMNIYLIQDSHNQFNLNLLYHIHFILLHKVNIFLLQYMLFNLHLQYNMMSLELIKIYLFLFIILMTNKLNYLLTIYKVNFLNLNILLY